jgi:predicted nucleotidyltransferase
MSAPIQVTHQELQLIKDLLRRFLDPHKVKAALFGSRIRNSARDDSDLDLLVHGENEIPLATMAKIKEAFEESSLLFHVDVVDFHRLNEVFRKLITEEQIPVDFL